jgi:predicted RNase H-like nuclease
MKFLGIDLGWSSGASGLCCLEWSDGCLNLLDLDRQQTTADILSWVDKWTAPTEPAMIAVDAPTLIPNATGMRLPDKLTHQHFRHYHAGCYPANLGRPFAQRTVEFGLSLEARGFAHAPIITPQTLGRYQIEVYPHPAIVHLFGLTRILKYKKGKLCDRRSELLKLHHYILNILPILTPSLTLSSSVCPPRLCGSFPLEIPSTGNALKAIEDQLDSLICAYVAAHWWYWGTEHNWVLGDKTTGYIVVPAPILGCGQNQLAMERTLGDKGDKGDKGDS